MARPSSAARVNRCVDLVGSRLSRRSPYRTGVHPSSVAIEVPSRLDSLEHVRAIVASFLAGAGLDPKGESGFGCLLATAEAVANAIRHGHGEDGRPLRMRVSTAEDGLRVEVWDEGPGFELAPTEIDSIDVWSESGRGVALMQAYVDRVEVRRDGDRNLLVLHKEVA